MKSVISQTLKGLPNIIGLFRSPCSLIKPIMLLFFLFKRKTNTNISFRYMSRDEYWSQEGTNVVSVQKKSICTHYFCPYLTPHLSWAPISGQRYLSLLYERSLAMCNSQPLLAAVDYTLMQLSKITYLHIIGQWRIYPYYELHLFPCPGFLDLCLSLLFDFCQLLLLPGKCLLCSNSYIF